MEGADYRFAVLLQRQLEQEHYNNSDLDLAVRLQQDFNKEVEIDNPATLVYDQRIKSKQDKRSLIDPSWEIIDPTPNIHNLFVTFNQQFFWNKLLAVCVSWSKRMTSCAGVCSYQGKGGMCSITLSEPLLKLRPRKDLVETLLHEMIHAYLFVTHNNKDRDGHGPEFHKHMYRINKEAGTCITVYHSFHDEVRLYQQHWWRCNGPCQNRKPYFGMVRRATNRAPGPNDRWWTQHIQTCGGTFTKVREPERKTKTQKENKPLVNIPSAGDIRKYVLVSNVINSTKNSSNSDIYSNTGNSNMPGLNIPSDCTQNKSKVSQVSRNIHGFSNLANHQKFTIGTSQPNVNKAFTIGNTTKTKTNSNSTIVINKKPGILDAGKSYTITKKVNAVPAETGNLLSPDKIEHKDNDDYSVVRNHWLNKFPVVSSNGIKRNTSNSLNEILKKQKTEPGFSQQINISSTMKLSSVVVCPICELEVKESLINAHLDLCLQDRIIKKDTDSKKLCSLCKEEVSQVDYQNHFDNCFKNNMNDNEEQAECEICNMHFIKDRIEEHRQKCIEEAFSESTLNPSLSRNIPNNIQNTTTLVQCPICDELIDSEEENNHKAKCRVYGNADEIYSLKLFNEQIKCLVCGENVLKNELNAHLDDCMGNVFDVKNDFNLSVNDKNNENGSCSENCDNKNSSNSKHNCPFCMELYSELDMSGHLDQCLINDLDTSTNKSILIDSFSNSDHL